MRISKISIQNFRGILLATLTLPDHAVLIGDNNTGKSSVLEAIDLVLGPDRLNRRPPVDEHDFFLGKYLAKPAAKSEPGASSIVDSLAQADVGSPDEVESAPRIVIEVTISDLSEEQQARFGDYIEWLNITSGLLYDVPDPAGVDAAAIVAALRVTFIGQYDQDEDDFGGNTYFSRSLTESDTPQPFTKKDKQKCGFLYLRSLRTGSRALSLEHGSLLDIILRLKEIRPQMWEDTISGLSSFNVANDPELGISGVLET